MRSVSGSLAAAITASDRTPTHQVYVDWDNDGTFSGVDDQTTHAESVTITRTLNSDLPDEVSLLAGYAAAECEILFSGDPTDEAKTAGWYYSPFSTASPIYGKRRRWRTCQVNVGFNGEQLTVFTGKTRSLATTATSQTATLEVIDNAELMRGAADLPLVVASDHAGFEPGLTASWAVDYIARKFGFNMAPPARANCLWSASFAGSAYPNIGGIIAANDLQFVPGQFISAATVDYGANSPTATYSIVGSAAANDGGELLIEGWFNPSILGGYHSFIQVTSDYTSATAPQVNLIELEHATTADTLGVSIRRTAGGASIEYDSGITLPLNAMNYLACHVYFTSTTIYFHWRVGSTSANTTASTSSVTGQPSLTQVNVGHGYASFGVLAQGTFNVEAAQVSNPGTTTSAPPWNDSYVGNSIIQPALNVLTATVPFTGSGWDLVQEIAAAELATVAFDEVGRFTFYTRNRWTSPPYTSSVLTITDSNALEDLTITEDTDQVRNRVRVTVSPATVQPYGFVWRTADVITVPASGSTSITAQLDNPTVNLDTTITASTTNNPTGSYYRANRTVTGNFTTITNLTANVTSTNGNIATITITNPNAYPVYLVNPAGFSDAQGTPALGLWGQAVLYAQSAEPDTGTSGVAVPTQTIIDMSDATSIDEHGEMLLERPANPWLQDAGSVSALVTDLLTRLKDPPPNVSAITIPADPRLQLGDRITLSSNALPTNAQFFITEITLTVAAGKATQTLETRPV